MVRFVLAARRPRSAIDLHVEHTATTSTRVSSGLVPVRDSSPSFGSQRVRSNSATSQLSTRRVSGAPPPARERGSRIRPTLRRPDFHFAAGLFKTH
ncbi:hypothetical protein JTE90_015440 [Oedothorax gibbosus]|uniref:Uncharacterized protein n=1 Tax=Oedothorax gibbosus TaxID=931172 RepID=A0AAV6TGM5_9ARAC|nr:hypothetical protein JTE90_015440 [Oedothorax gibbosus]